MKQKIVGNSYDLAEIIIDYNKKKVDIINPISRKKILESDLDFRITPFFILACGYILIIYFAFVMEYTIYNFFILLNICLFVYLLFVINKGLRKKLHYYSQKLFNDKFRLKKFIKISDINKKIYQLPREYEFKNYKFDYKLFGDYSKYVEKVHIKPWDFKYINVSRKKENQFDKWDVFIYFSKVPKIGYMELTFI